MVSIRIIKKHIVKTIILNVALIFCHSAIGQDIHFSQFFANKLFLAPSFAGATQQNRFISNYRNQWPGLPKAFVTYAFSYDHNFQNFNSGMGLIALRDVAGTGKYGTLQLGLCYSFDFLLNDEIHIRPGAGFSYIQRSIDFMKLIMGDQLTNGGTNPSSIETFPGKDYKGSVDASSSIIAYSKNMWGGITVDHLLRPNLSIMGGEERLPIKIDLYGGATLLRKGRLLRPIDETLSFAFKFTNQAKYRQLDLGLYWSKSPLIFGFWYRGIPPFNSDRGDSFALLSGIKVQNFTLGYSYDFTISNLIGHSSGSHELSISYEFSRTRKKKMSSVPCPEF